jgi:hypothetical protein
VEESKDVPSDPALIAPASSDPQTSFQALPLQSLAAPATSKDTDTSKGQGLASGLLAKPIAGLGTA